MFREQLKGNLDVLLLGVLKSGPAHGYAIITALRERSDGTFDLPEGTVYPALHRLEKQRLIRSRWDDTTGRRRRVYVLCAAGANALNERTAEWHTFATAVAAVLA